MKLRDKIDLVSMYSLEAKMKMKKKNNKNDEISIYSKSCSKRKMITN